MRIFLKDELAAGTDWLVDFGNLKAAYKPINAQLDHRYLNEIEGLGNPTAENIAIWIWNQLNCKIENLHYASSEDVLKWYEQMASTEFLMSELDDPSFIMPRIKELLYE